MLKSFQRDNSREFQVLNHEDFHIRNLMFKQDKNFKLTDVKFLVFQMPNFNLPSFDLLGLLNSIVTAEVRKQE